METISLQKRESQELRKSDQERRVPLFNPRADIFENGSEVVLVLDMPGVDAEHVDITLEHDVLTMSGHLKERIPEGYALRYREYETGGFQRRFTLSDTFDRDAIRARVKEGVLRVTLPKQEAEQARKISIES